MALHMLLPVQETYQLCHKRGHKFLSPLECQSFKSNSKKVSNSDRESIYIKVASKMIRLKFYVCNFQNWLRIPQKIYYRFCLDFDRVPDNYFDVTIHVGTNCQVWAVENKSHLLHRAPGNKILLTVQSDLTVFWRMLHYGFWSKFNRFTLDGRDRSLHYSAQFDF